jgi:hypothetical protein
LTNFRRKIGVFLVKPVLCSIFCINKQYFRVFMSHSIVKLCSLIIKKYSRYLWSLFTSWRRGLVVMFLLAKPCTVREIESRQGKYRVVAFKNPYLAACCWDADSLPSWRRFYESVSAVIYGQKIVRTNL